MRIQRPRALIAGAAAVIAAAAIAASVAFASGSGAAGSSGSAAPHGRSPLRQEASHLPVRPWTGSGPGLPRRAGTR